MLEGPMIYVAGEDIDGLLLSDSIECPYEIILSSMDSEGLFLADCYLDGDCDYEIMRRAALDTPCDGSESHLYYSWNETFFFFYSIFILLETLTDRLAHSFFLFDFCLRSYYGSNFVIICG